MKRIRNIRFERNVSRTPIVVFSIRTSLCSVLLENRLWSVFE